MENYLMHYGVKGMKWGVHRCRSSKTYDPEHVAELVNKGKIAVDTLLGNTVIANMTAHALERSNMRKVCARDIKNALKMPVYTGQVIRYDKQDRPSQRFVGDKALVCINPTNGNLSTIWEAGRKSAERERKRDLAEIERRKKKEGK